MERMSLLKSFVGLKCRKWPFRWGRWTGSAGLVGRECQGLAKRRIHLFQRSKCGRSLVANTESWSIHRPAVISIASSLTQLRWNKVRNYGVGSKSRSRTYSTVKQPSESQPDRSPFPSVDERAKRENGEVEAGRVVPAHKSPSHPNLIRVVHSPEAYSSWAESLVDLPAGAHFASFEGATYTAERRYSTVQVDAEEEDGFLWEPISSSNPVSISSSSSSSSSIPDPSLDSHVHRAKHIELNSDLLYANHSCTPSLIFDTARMEARVVDDRPLRKGDRLTFFYPSTEWRMDRPFRCECGAGEGKCKGWISGAAEMEEPVLREYWLSEHVERLLRERSDRRKGRKWESRLKVLK